MNEFETRVSTVLRDHADGEVDVRALTAGAIGVGIRRERRRRVGRIAAGGLALTVLAVAVVGGSRWLPGRSGQGSAPVASTSQSGQPAGPVLVYQRPTYDPGTRAWAGVPTPPLDAAAPSAVQDPATVGTAGLVHFSFASEAGLGAATTVTYQTGPLWGVERAQIEAGPGCGCVFELSRSRPGTGPTHAAFLDGARSRPVVVGTVAGTYHFFEPCDGCGPVRDGVGTLVWQPAPGLWALLNIGGGEARAVQAAGGLRLDRTYRVVVPYRLATVPAGTTVQNAVMTFQGGMVTSGSHVGATVENSVAVRSGPRAAMVGGGNTVLPPMGPGVTNEVTTINGNPAIISTSPYCDFDDRSSECTRVTVPKVIVMIDLGQTIVALSNWGNIDRVAVLAAAAALTDLYTDDLAEWPTSPLP
ncbi:hypothetical protein [Virgisporangium aurantiacum]|uniref:Uncharacterized protein n=1 Tax=Virgisporangium aurantiacum TaxID=175570 RepID=A0A8J4E0Z2_9ACTN|nr:hypothetical protein [Virgisporangium aurantiacum]GIJ57326.1 hypothetical protein Vau01_048420 [Virgisporangium aurantiacum]